MSNRSASSLPLRSRLAAALPLAALLLLPGAPLARAGSTGSTGLYTPQGGSAGTANGDFISSPAPGLDTFYRYFVEVPPGQSRLVIEIFDADVGIGGDPEGNAGRDRDRNGFDTTATYSLVNPAGTARTTQFTTGNTTLPAGADNAWLALYDSTGENFRDNFDTNAYTNNDGSLNWAGNWTETNDDGSATGGAIQVNGGRLRIQEDGGGASTIHREANLTAAGFGSATFSFSFQVDTRVDDGDQMRVQVSGNGGGAWTTLETFTGDFGGAVQNRSYDISGFIATNTRVRFLHVTGYSGGQESFFVDNLQIQAGSILAGHWEVRVNQSAGGTDINAFGIRAHDGNSGSGGTEYNVYYDSHNQYGVNPPASGTTSRSYDFYPYITSGCSASKNDFDYDSNRGNVGSMSLTSRTGTFTQTYTTTSLSEDDRWRQDSFTGWTSDTDSTGYGIWSADVTITSYLVGGTPNGNYANLWFGNFDVTAAQREPSVNPTPNAFRVYAPTDANGAPSKPYLEQLLRYAEVGPNPPAAGQTSQYTVTVRVVNPAAFAITFSTPSNVVTANIPGSGVTYAGSAAVGQGSIVSQPSVGGTGSIVWNPGTLAAGATAVLSYRVSITPASAGQRLLATGTPASNGTRAQFLDETGNTSQSRATYLAGPVCGLAVTEGLLTEAVISSFEVHEEAGGVAVEWETASEAGTVGFDLYRFDPALDDWVQVNGQLLLGLLHSPQGGTYRFVDEGASPRERHSYLLVEVEANGNRKPHGPFTLQVERGKPRKSASLLGPGYQRVPHPPAKAPDLARKPARLSSAPAALGEVLTGGSAALHLSIREPGLYYVSASELGRFLGVASTKAEKMIAAGEVALSRLGEPVAWLPDPVGATEKSARGLYFYGEPTDSLYTEDTVYWLGRGNGLRMETLTVAPSSVVDTAAGFDEVMRREQDRLPATVLSPDPESDYWFWDFLQSGDATFGTRAFPLDAPGLVMASSAQGSLTVHLQGATTTGIPEEHHVEIRLNGTPLGEARWEGIAAHSATVPVPLELLQPTGNQVEVAGLLDAGVPFSILYVDSVELAYPRSLQASGDALSFQTGGSSEVSVGGFSSASVILLDITDPLRPRRVESPAVESEGAAFRIGFRPSFRDLRYLAAGPTGVKRPTMQAWQEADLRSPAQRADYLVLTTTALRAPAERLAEHRRRQGLETLVVDMTTVADEFGFGVPTPHAIRSFLSYASQSWQKAPRYVVLAGAGTLDYRNLLGFGGNLVPPLMVQGTGGLFASDNRLADVTGDDGLPEMAIGRIPVATAAELDAYVDKIVAYEEGSSSPGPETAWTGRALLLADAPDRGADFAAASERIAGFLPDGYSPERIYLAVTPLDQARADLLQALGEGAAVVNYLGHGGLDRLAGSGLLASADVPGLANGSRLPVVTAMTCTVNRFGVPGVPPLGELLVKSPSGGAAAVWGPSGLSINAEAGLLAERFYRLLGEPEPGHPLQPLRLGDLVLRSLTDFAALGGNDAMLDIYNLLGDPGLRLRRAVTAPAQGSAVGTGE